MNEKLRTELLSMRKKDISTRKRLADNGELLHGAYHPEMKRVHEENNFRIKEIINNGGWPLESEVGEDGAEAAWLIVQHAVLEPGFQKKCVILLENAVEKGEANSWHLAYLQDRVLVHENKPQIFGTQHIANNGKMEPLPIEDIQQANLKRAELGLWSLEEHTAHLQNDYDSIQRNKAKVGGAPDS
jgi:hypothetical protein